MSESRQLSETQRSRLKGMELDFERCYRAVDSRDQRFDGWFFTAVTSTGIYCRPSCPAMTPKRENVTFFPSAAAAQRGGFRACKRCRPDAAPGSPEWDVRADLVGRAMRLIGDGVVDREGVAGLAARLGYSVRQLNRLVSSELGNTPTICRKSYVHPMVVARYIDEGDTIALPAARRVASDRGQAHSPEERALIAFLDRHFPERRRKPRRADGENDRRAA